MTQTVEINYEKIRAIIREEIDSTEFVKEMMKVQEEKGISFESVDDLDELVKNA